MASAALLQQPMLSKKVAIREQDTIAIQLPLHPLLLWPPALSAILLLDSASVIYVTYSSQQGLATAALPPPALRALCYSVPLVLTAGPLHAP